jgi:hypothetical protein
MAKVKIKFGRDELYPVYVEDNVYGNFEIEMTESQITEYRRVYREFSQWLAFLQKLEQDEEKSAI